MQELITLCEHVGLTTAGNNSFVLTALKDTQNLTKTTHLKKLHKIYKIYGNVICLAVI